jgi:hypothetical protein
MSALFFLKKKQLTRKRTPTGASAMIHCVILIMMTVIDVKKLKTG